MKTGRMFWGVFFLSLGIAFMLERFGVVNLQWQHAWRYWPVVLIAWGVAILFGGTVVKRVAVIVAAAVLALVLAALLSFSWADDVWEHGALTQEQVFREGYGAGSEHASFKLESGAGTFALADTTADFIEARTATSFGTYALEREGGPEGTAFVLNMSGVRHGWPPGRMRNKAEVRLNSGPVWDLGLEIGAAKVRCDLTPFKVENLNVDCGAADVELRLGGGVPESTVKINAGASSLRIGVPSEAGCEIRVEAPFSKKNFPGFTRISKGRFQSENYERTTRRIFVEIDAGVSSIKVERY
jgi:hypothetical protein